MDTYNLDGLTRALFEEAGDALFLFDPETDELLDVNPMAEKLSGFSRSELLRTPATYLFRFGAKGGKKRLREAASRSGVFHSQEGYFLRTNQSGVWVAVNLTVSRLHVQPKTLALITARDVRAQREANARLQKMEAELSRVLASVSDCLWSAERDAEGTWVPCYISPVIEKLTGRPAAYFLAGAPSWWAIVHPDDIPGAREAFSRLKEGSSVQQEYRVFRTDGSVRWLRNSVQVSRVRPDDGSSRTVLRLDGVLTDVTDRRQAEELLVQERNLLHALMNNLPDSIYFKDAQSRFLRINKSLAARFGLSDPAEAVGKSDFDFFTEEHARPAFEDEQEVMRSGEPVVAKEEKETWADGRQRWVSSTKLPLRDAEGRVVGTFGISRDITRRKHAEQERIELLAREQQTRRELESALASLRESEARLRRLFASSIIGVVFADIQGTISDANDAFLQMVGYAREDLPLRWDLQLTPTEYRPADRRAVAQLLRRGTATPWEKEYLRKDGSRVPVLLGAAMLEGSPGECVCFVLDMTERNRMRAMVAQTEKLASIGLLSAGLAHEINNPLAYVANNLAVLERNLHGLLAVLDAYEAAHAQLKQAAPETARRIASLREEHDLPYVRENLDRVVSRTREGVQRITRIVQSLRGLARTDRNQTEEVPLSDLIDMSLEMVRGRIKRHHMQLDVDCPPSLRLRCVPTQISQVLLNLLVNAVQAVEASARAEDGGRVRVGAAAAGDELLIEVCDNGCGIDPEDLPQIFDPFFTRKPVGEGTGLGLSISHGIVTGHGGRIEVESHPGEGSCFRVYLPLDGNPAPEGEGQA